MSHLEPFTELPPWPRVTLPALDFEPRVALTRDASLLHAALREQIVGGFTTEQARAYVAEALRIGQPFSLATVVDVLEKDELEALITRVPAERWFVADSHVRLLVLRLRERALPLVHALLEARRIGSAAVLEVVSPAAATAHARAMTAEARRWLLANDALALASLAHASLTGPDEDRVYVGAALRWLARRDRGAAIRALAAGWGEPAQAAIEDVLDPRRDAPPLFSRALPKSWASRKVHTREGETLDAASMQTLGRLLATPFPPEHPAMRAAIEACDPASLAELGRALWLEWTDGGMATQNQWIAHASVVLGGESAVKELGRAARTWARAKDSHTRRTARKVAEVFVWLGTETCMAELVTLARTARDADTRARIEALLELVAIDRGVTIDDLAAPSVELDVPLSYGARRFTPVWSREHTLEVRDESGQCLPDLPRPTKKDDAALAKAAKETWKALREAARDALVSERTRLERAMIEGTHVPLDRWRARLASSEPSRRLAQALAWAAHDRERTTLFRVAEDASFATLDDDLFVPSEDASVSIPHPVLLDDATRARWIQVFASYELLSPFPQLERSVYRDASVVGGREIHPGKVLGLRERGWRLLRRQSGNVDGLERAFATGTLRVDVEPGFWPERLADVPMQRLGVLEATTGDPSSIAWSEAIRDLLG
jgi:hypothetical protein